MSFKINRKQTYMLLLILTLLIITINSAFALDIIEDFSDITLNGVSPPTSLNLYDTCSGYFTTTPPYYTGTFCNINGTYQAKTSWKGLWEKVVVGVDNNIIANYVTSNVMAGGDFGESMIYGLDNISNEYGINGLVTIHDNTLFKFDCYKRWNWGDINYPYGVSELNIYFFNDTTTTTLSKITIYTDRTFSSLYSGGNYIFLSEYLGQYCSNTLSTIVINMKDLLDNAIADNYTSYSVNYMDKELYAIEFTYADACNGICATNYGEMNLDNIQLLNLNSTENELPEFNVSINTDNFCVDKSFDISKQKVFFNLSFNVFDKENDNIYYATSISEENFINYLSFNRENPVVCRYGIEIGFGINIFPNLKWNCRDVRTSTKGVAFVSTLSGYLDEQGTTRCIIDYYELNRSNIYIDNWVNFYGVSVPMLIIPSSNTACIGKTREAIIDLNDNFFDFNTQIGLYYLWVSGIEFNISIYQSSINDLVPIKQKFRFRVQNATTMRVADNSNKTIGFMPIPQTETEGLTYFMRHLLFKTTYDYNTDKFNLTLSNGYQNYSFGNISSASTSFFNFPIKYVGISNSNNSILGFYYDLYVEDIAYGGFDVKPIWSNQKPNNVSIINFGSNELIVFVTDEYHKDKNEFSYETIKFFVSDTSICLQKLKDAEERLDGSYQNINGLTGIPYYFDLIRYLLQFPFRFANNFGFAEMIQGGSIIFLILFFWYHYSEFHNLTATALLTFGEAVMLNIMKLIYLDIYILLAFFFSLFLAKELLPQQSQLEHSEIKYIVRWYALFTIILLISQLTSQADIGFKTFNFSIDTSGQFGFLGGLWDFITNLFGFIVNLFTWSISPIAENYITAIFIAIINMMLWLSRIVVIVELLPMIKKVVPFF